MELEVGVGVLWGQSAYTLSHSPSFSLSVSLCSLARDSLHSSNVGLSLPTATNPFSHIHSIVSLHGLTPGCLPWCLEESAFQASSKPVRTSRTSPT